MTKSICNKLLIGTTFRVREGTPLNEHLNELNFFLMELRDIDAKMENKNLTMILLAFLPTSYENFVSSLNVGKDSTILEDVKSNLYSR